MSISFLLIECGAVMDSSAQSLPALDLPMAKEDVGELARLIHARFPNKNLDIVVSEPELAAHPGYALSLRSNILEALGSFSERSKTSSLRVIYYAGHGVVNDAGELYLVPSDFKQGLCEQTGIPVSHIFSCTHGLGGETVVLLDCCRQNAQMEVLPTLKPFSVRMGVRSHLVLGCSDGEACHEIEDQRLRGGIFTSAFLTALKACLETSSLQDIFDLMVDEQNKLIETFVKNRTQHPQIYSHNASGVPLGRIIFDAMSDN